MKGQGVIEGKGLTQKRCFALDSRKYQLQNLAFQTSQAQNLPASHKKQIEIPTSEIFQVFLPCLGP